MKIRLMGSPDLVRAWRQELERAYGVAGAEYPCRGSTDVRCYIDIDDRAAERIVRTQMSTAQAPQTKKRKPKALFATKAPVST